MMKFKAIRSAAVALAVILPMGAALAASRATPPAPLPANVVKNTTGTTPPPKVVVAPKCTVNTISPC